MPRATIDAVLADPTTRKLAPVGPAAMFLASIAELIDRYGPDEYDSLEITAVAPNDKPTILAKAA